MSRFVIGNLFLLLSMVCATASQVVLKALIDEVQPGEVSWSTVKLFLTPERLLRGGASMVLLVAGFAFWVLCLVRLNLSYAYPIACSSVLLVALFSVIVLGEPMTARTWIGTVLVLAGVIFLAPPA
jgi:drug/metabolite transporter (DMT)-like permease